ncbi:MAG: NAD(+)/NADH kinase [Christensenellales bacterium]
MKVGIFTNLHKDKDLSVTKALLKCLSYRGVSYAVDEELKSKVQASDYFSLSKPADFDFMLTVGGDGTILRVAKYCARYHIPVAGLNLGFVGFLTEEEPDRVDFLVDALINGQYSLERRTLLSAEAEGKCFFALNDVVVSRDSDSRMLEADVFVNDEFVDRYFCDGYIVSTPTGSTAYSLSAGGPILSPNVAAFILTSINSHSLHSRPIVVSENDEIALRIGGRGSVNLVVDGVSGARLSGGAEIRLKKSDAVVSFVRLSGHGFFNKLLTKLNKWGITSREE